jgi:hypothetical protein
MFTALFSLGFACADSIRWITIGDMRRPLLLLFFLCACSGGGGGGSSPPTPPAVPGLVSGSTPYSAGCGLGGTGTLYTSAEVEPHIAVDPRDANHLVGAWQQDRWSDGSARGVVTAASFDGGLTWSQATPAFSTCSGGPDVRATDPWVAITRDGVVLVVALTTTGGTFQAGATNAVQVARSTDGGRTFLPPVTVLRSGGAFFSDKETMTADPTDGRFVYAVWDRLIEGAGGPTWFARSVDGGVTWEDARIIQGFNGESQSIGNLIRVLPDGTLVNLYMYLQGGEDNVELAQVQVIRSTDKGATWSAPIVVADYMGRGARAPNAIAVRDGSIIPQMAVAPNGTLYVVWQDARFTGVRDAIAISRSTDGGLTWSAPTRVNSAAQAAAFTPQVHVRGDGVVGVTFFDFRSEAGVGAQADYWLARSADGGATWTETRVANTFNLAQAPLVSGAYFLGDYMGLTSAGTAFIAFYTRTTGPSLTDVFATRIEATAAVTQMALSAVVPSEDPRRAALAHAADARRARLR